MIRPSIFAAIFITIWCSYGFPQPSFYPPVNLGSVINTSYHESDPFLAADGRRLFFVRDFDIWYAEWNGTDWINPTKLGPQINTGPGIEHSPSISPDGQKLYFVPDLRDGFFWDVWVSVFDSSRNDWGTPVNLGAPVNTTGAEYSAHLDPDARHLYFSSDGGGRCGIYSSEWDGVSWSSPIKVSVSSCAIDEYPSITVDDRWYYFFRYLPDSGGSIFVSYWTDLDWSTPLDLWPQIGRGGTPFITPSGDSLFFASSSLSGFGGADIWLARRIVLGDLNLDGRHSPADVVLELNKVFLGKSYPAPEERGDMNCDMAFSPADVIRLLLLVFEDTPPEC